MHGRGSYIERRISYKVLATLKSDTTIVVQIVIEHRTFLKEVFSVDTVESGSSPPRPDTSATCPRGLEALSYCTDSRRAAGRRQSYLAPPLHRLLVGTCGVDVGIGGAVSDTRCRPTRVLGLALVMCLAACDKAPMLQCNFHYHQDLDMEKMKTLIDQWRGEANAAKP